MSRPLTSSASAPAPVTSVPSPNPNPAQPDKAQRPRPASLLRPPATIISPPSPVDPREGPMFDSPTMVMPGSPFSSPPLGSGGSGGGVVGGSGGGGGGGWSPFSPQGSFSMDPTSGRGEDSSGETEGEAREGGAHRSSSASSATFRHPWTGEEEGFGTTASPGLDRKDSLGVVDSLRRQTLGDSDDQTARYGAPHGNGNGSGNGSGNRQAARPPVSRQTTTSSSFSFGSTTSTSPSPWSPGTRSQPGSPNPPASALAATYLSTSPLLSPSLPGTPGTPGTSNYGLGIGHPATPGAGSSSRPHSPRPSSPQFRPKPLGHRRESSTHRVRETLSGEERVQEGVRMINQYRIGRSLGQGGYAKVELGVDVGTGQEYAIKEFSKSRLHYQALQAKHRQSTRTRTRPPPPRSRNQRDEGGKRKAPPGSASPDTPDGSKDPSASEAHQSGPEAEGESNDAKPGDGGKDGKETKEIQQQGAEGGRAGPWDTGAVDTPGKEDPLGLIRREIAVMKKLDHPNLVHLYEAISVNNADSLFLVLEYMPGGVMMKVPMGQEAEDAKPPFDQDQAREYFRQLCLGLEYLHANGVVHRDVKPDNILLSADKEVVKLCDFGVSEMFLTEGDDRIKKSGGSPAFLSPESFMSQNGEIHGKAVDMWALGVTLYCLIAGRLPWSVHTAMELYDVVRTKDPPLREDWDAVLRQLISRMLDRNAQTRAQMDEVRENPWVTSHGTEMMISREDNLYYVGRQVEEPTENELAGAFGTLKGVFTVIRAVQKMRRLQLHRRSLTSSPATPGSAPGSVKEKGDTGSDGSPEVLSLGAARMAHEAGARAKGGASAAGHAQGRPQAMHQSSVDSYVSALSMGSMGSSTGEGGKTETSGTTADAEEETDSNRQQGEEGIEDHKGTEGDGTGQVGEVVMEEPMDMDDDNDDDDDGTRAAGAPNSSGDQAKRDEREARLKDRAGEREDSGKTASSDPSAHASSRHSQHSLRSEKSTSSDHTASHRPSRLKEQLGDYRAPPSPETSRPPADALKLHTSGLSRERKSKGTPPDSPRKTEAPVLGVNTKANEGRAKGGDMRGSEDEDMTGERVVDSPTEDLDEVQIMESPTDV